MKHLSITFSILTALLWSQSLSAGKLDDFEADANRTKSKQSSPSYNKNDTDCDGFIDCVFLEPFFDAIFDVSLNNLSDSLTNQKQDINNFYIIYDHQDIDQNIHANHFEINFELTSFGFNCKSSHFNESEPNDKLTIQRCHALLLLQRGKSFGAAVGIGGYNLDGNSRESGTSFSIPVTYNYSSRLSFKATYERYDSIKYFDTQLFIGKKLRLVSGYKQFLTENEDLSGPYIGLAYKW